MIEDDPLSSYDAVGRQLARFGRIALHAVPLSRMLLAQGLEVLSSRFGGLLSHADEVLDPTMERFEVELLRERFGSIALLEDGQLRVLGYRSPFLDALLGEAGITRHDLESLRRPAAVDERIDAHAWACRYRRDVLIEQRSGSMGEAIGRQKQIEGARVARPDVTAADARRVFRDRVEPLFVAHGFASHRVGRSGDQLRFSRSATSSADVGVEFVIDLSAMPKGRLPLSVSMAMQPVIVGDVPPAFAVPRALGNFLGIVEPLVPNFGRYRGAWVPLEFSAQLHAYECLLRACLPLLIATCDANEDTTEPRDDRA